MTHDELLNEIDAIISIGYAESGFSEYAANGTRAEKALRAVVELHKPELLDERGDVCLACCPDLLTLYPCPTIQAIEKELG